jgi:arylformamidase
MSSEMKDITMPIYEGMMVYKNKPEKQFKSIQRATHAENGYHEGSVCMDLHTGTHIDMPLHVIDGGADSTHFDTDSVNGPCVVVDFSKETSRAVDADFLKKQSILEGDIVLIKTKNSYAEAFDFEFDFLEASGAAYLRDLQVKAVGIDALGIERNQPGQPTHKALLGNGIYIIEGLALKAVESGRYLFHCFPLKIMGVEGLPARAFLSPLPEEEK